MGAIHYNDVIMTTMASQTTSLKVVYSTVYSDADQRKHQSSASLAFVWGIHRDRWIPRTKGQLRGKCFHLMTSSCSQEMLKISILIMNLNITNVIPLLYLPGTNALMYSPGACLRSRSLACGFVCIKTALLCKSVCWNSYNNAWSRSIHTENVWLLNDHTIIQTENGLWK